MSMIALFVANLRQRWAERCGRRSEPTYLRDLHAVWTSDVIRSRRTVRGGSRNLRIIRSQQRTVLARKAS